MDILISNAAVVTMNTDADVLQCAFVGITGGKITYIGYTPPKERAARVIDGTGKVVLPGFVNCHTHAAMSILRGYADDYNLQDWLEKKVFPAERKMDAHCIYVGTQLALAEMISSGTIAICDMYSKIPQVARAAFEAGVYANIGNGAISFDREKYNFERDGVTDEMRKMLEHWHGADSGRIVLDASIHAEYTSFDRVWRANAEFAQRHGLNMHVHVSETVREHRKCIERYGRTPARVLADAGVFDTKAVAAHCVYASDEDMDIFAQKGVTVAHNPISNLKLASGIAPVSRMLSRGVNVALGTDGVCSNNSHDMFEEIKMAALLQKGATLDSVTVPAAKALEMATVNGARALGREEQMGRLCEQMDASLIMIDLNTPHLMPVHGLVSSLAYSARGGDVCLTMVRGRVIYEAGRFMTIDIERVCHELKNYVMPRVFGA